MTSKKMLLRSMMFVPANNSKFIEKALASAADALILDFEDAVPDEQKDEARTILKGYIDDRAFKGSTVFIRTNAMDSPELLRDIECGMHEDITGFMPPKITSRNDIVFFEKLLTQKENAHGIAAGHFKLAPLIETTGAVLNLSEILRGNTRLVALCFGGDDFLGDLHGTYGDPPVAHFTPRAMIAMAARSAGLIPIDTPYLYLHDIEGLKREKEQGFELGFGGALLISPRHIDIINKCFTPSKEEAERAQAITDAIKRQKNIRSGGGLCIMLGERMIGPPMQRRAEWITELIELVKAKEGN
ncbi:MAG: CoA ester lyase [Clostridiales Family XIII bacterium]|nr:CoA ester lyase [Clostridiales Family XIII bacterium]